MGRNLVKFFFSSHVFFNIRITRSYSLQLFKISLIREYDVIIVILMSRQLGKWKVFIVSLFFWMD